MVHGHFFGMGGFTVVDSSHVDDDPKDGSQDGEVLTLREYETCFKNDRDFSIPTLTDDELKDRSKADALAKSIAFLQTLLFLLQCLARHHQGLVLTELELVTVALASLNFFTYAIWWDKPKSQSRYISREIRLQRLRSHRQWLNQRLPQWQETPTYVS